MFHSGKRLRLLSTLLVLGWCLGSAAPAWANLPFYSIVQQVCKSYRVPVTMKQMDLEESGDNGATFTLALQSRRNNFEEVILVGYVAASQAIARTGIEIKTINITVTIPKADNMLLMTTADVALVEQLRLGKIKSSQFMQKLEWN
ncbi:MAG: hypothetical protein JSU77_13410 [Fidelibacterota bacterium]|nr:MAG: hypothetical protein JSU77_13410 [Candidatus Neomarinimicrobiota bacterium]